jgi:ribosome biogenesis GTPase / thiamine phosphate phosphatase
LNLLVPEAVAHTQEISQVLNAGKHTTTFARLHAYQQLSGWSGQVIDSPGFQLFAIAHLSVSELMHAMPEVAARLGQCRFSNCLHADEPGCAVREAAQKGEIDGLRFRLFRQIVQEGNAAR